VPHSNVAETISTGEESVRASGTSELKRAVENRQDGDLPAMEVRSGDGLALDGTLTAEKHLDRPSAETSAPLQIHAGPKVSVLWPVLEVQLEGGKSLVEVRDSCITSAVAMSDRDSDDEQFGR
jgi:hypothetical protein